MSQTAATQDVQEVSSDYDMHSVSPPVADHTKQFYLAIFFMIDHAGKCPADTTKHQFQDAVIEAHLQRHTYFYDSPGSPQGQSRADVEKIRSVFEELYRHVQASGEATKVVYSRQPDEDHADPFFRLGTAQLPRELLASCGYDESNTQEDGLPGYIPPPASKGKKSGVWPQYRHTRRSFWTLIQDIEATKSSCGHSRYKYRNSESRDDALKVLIQDFKLTQDTKEGCFRNFDSKTLSKSFQASWVVQKAEDVAFGASPWESDRTDWKPSYVESVERVCNELNTQESLPSYNPGTAVSLSTDLMLDDGETTQTDHTSTASEESTGNEDANKMQIVNDGEPNAESGHADDGREGTEVGHASNKAAIAASPAVLLPMQRPLECTHEATSRAAQEDAGRATEIPTSSRARTRFRPFDEVSDSPLSLHMGVSRSDGVYRSSAEQRPKRISLETPVGRKRQRTRDLTPSKATTSTLQPDEKTQAGAGRRFSDDLDDTTLENEFDATQEMSVSQLSLPERLDQPQHSGESFQRRGLIALNFSQLDKDFKNLYFKLSGALDGLLENIGNVGQDVMPLERDPPQGTIDLHVRCWGTEWQQVRADLKASNLFSVPDVVLSLISAYLFDKILDRPAMKTHVSLSCEGSHESGYVGDEDTVKRIHALIAQDSLYEECLRPDAFRLAKDLWLAISPHIRRLAVHANDHDSLRPGSNESMWLRSIESSMTTVIQQAIIFRTRLMGTDCTHSFTWPRAGQEYEPKTMQTKMGGATDMTPKRVVAFTLFPGLDVTASDLNEGQVEPVYRAVVKLLPVHGGRTSSAVPLRKTSSRSASTGIGPTAR